MKQILISTNFSVHSRHTLEYVMDLVHDAQIPCRLLLVNTYMVQQTNPDRVIQVNDELKRLSKAGLEREREDAQKMISKSNIIIDTACHMGSLIHVIMQLIQKEKIDLVAMGKDGGKHVEAVSAMLKQQECPLLITYLKE